MTSYEIGFKVQHDCPFNDLSIKFPSITISHWCNNDYDLLEISYDRMDIYDSVQESVKDLAKELGARIQKKSFMSSNQQLILGHCKCNHYKSTCPVIEKNHCLELYPTMYKGGWEWYRIIAFSEKDIKALFRELGEFCKVDVYSRSKITSGAIKDDFVISSSSLLGGLTEKQRMALISAIGNGYYLVPKKVTTEEIAKRLGVPRTTYEEHLRKAESKILGSVAPYLEFTPKH